MTEDQVDRRAEAEAENEGDREGRKPGTSIVEWVIAVTSCILLFLVLITLVVEGLSEPARVAELIVRPVGTATTDSGFVVEFAATNRSAKSVSAVEITGELRNGGQVVEARHARLDYMPKESEQRGAVIFQNDPRSHELHFFAVAYSEP
ncbi:hypothetical protein ILFOPFJJ_01850 [Ensifer psoraleae]|uniref:TIGR02588 family protein n=1 Tax=Sinorhizobium psoraleae TaxID=520838 RepID=UPI0015684167|nr:TIGR02588 family protein [Sinorhizobium psoraleae]NRP70968.1 hypothetical protein [Sinorhizobium psoraleae]